MKLYLAASSADIDRARRWRDQLVAAGITVTSTWIENISQVGDANPRGAARSKRSEWSVDDLIQVDNSDTLWLLAPPADKPTRGAWLEFGYAVAKRLAVVSSGDTKQSIFTALGMEFADDHSAFVAIKSLADVAGGVRRERT